MNVIETQGLTKVYSRRRVVDGLDMRVRQGDIYGFVGKNGAGKSTVMKMICGLATPTAGSVRLFGTEMPGADGHGGRELASGRAKRASRAPAPAPTRASAAARTPAPTRAPMPDVGLRVGALIESPGLLDNLTAADNLMAKALALGVSDAREQTARLLTLVGLEHAGRKKVRGFSLGMRQRLGFALALVGSPDLLLLDEPLNGLDPEGVRDMRDLITRLNQVMGTTILISSHVLDQLDRMVTRYGVIAGRRLVREMTAEQVQAECEDSLRVRTADPSRTLALLQDRMPNLVTRVEPDGGIVITGAPDTAGVASLLHEADQVILELSVRQRDIEEYFLALMDGGERHV